MKYIAVVVLSAATVAVPEIMASGGILTGAVTSYKASERLAFEWLIEFLAASVRKRFEIRRLFLFT